LILRVRVVFGVAFALVASVVFARVAIALQVLTRQSVQLDAMHCCKYRGAWRASTLSSAPERFSASPWLKRQLQRHWASHLCTDQVAAFSLLLRPALRLVPAADPPPSQHILNKLSVLVLDARNVGAVNIVIVVAYQRLSSVSTQAIAAIVHGAG
jgi:hypothetical protein